MHKYKKNPRRHFFKACSAATMAGYGETSMEKSELGVKLLIDTESNKVLFAEANKDFVDFLFRILSLPLATVIGLLKKHDVEGSLGNLYTSIEDLDEEYIQPGKNKPTLLKPILPASDTSFPLLQIESSSSAKKFYGCGRTCSYCYVSTDARATCPSCRQTMCAEKTLVAPPSDGQESNLAGFVKEAVTYMVMDDLVVKPLSTISSISSLKKLNVQNLDALQEKEVKVTMNEALKLLKASLHSDQVLTEVFVSGRQATDGVDGVHIFVAT